MATSAAQAEAEHLFCSASIPEIRASLLKMRNSINAKKEETRLLVGARFRELIDSADTMTKMQTSCDQLLDSFREMSRAANGLARFRAVGWSLGQTSSVEKRCCERPLDDNAERRAVLFDVGQRVKFLVDTPDFVWRCLDARETLAAACRLRHAHAVYAQLTTTALPSNAGAGGAGAHASSSLHMAQVVALFPLLTAQWQAISRLPSLVVRAARSALTDCSIAKVAAAVLSLVLCDALDALEQRPTAAGSAAPPTAPTGASCAPRAPSATPLLDACRLLLELRRAHIDSLLTEAAAAAAESVAAPPDVGADGGQSGSSGGAVGGVGGGSARLAVARGIVAAVRALQDALGHVCALLTDSEAQAAGTPACVPPAAHALCTLAPEVQVEATIELAALRKLCSDFATDVVAAIRSKVADLLDSFCGPRDFASIFTALRVAIAHDPSAHPSCGHSPHHINLTSSGALSFRESTLSFRDTLTLPLPLPALSLSELHDITGTFAHVPWATCCHRCLGRPLDLWAELFAALMASCFQKAVKSALGTPSAELELQACLQSVIQGGIDGDYAKFLWDPTGSTLADDMALLSAALSVASGGGAADKYDGAPLSPAVRRVCAALDAQVRDTLLAFSALLHNSPLASAALASLTLPCPPTSATSTTSTPSLFPATAGGCSFSSLAAAAVRSATHDAHAATAPTDSASLRLQHHPQASASTATAVRPSTKATTAATATTTTIVITSATSELAPVADDALLLFGHSATDADQLWRELQATLQAALGGWVSRLTLLLNHLSEDATVAPAAAALQAAAVGRTCALIAVRPICPCVGAVLGAEPLGMSLISQRAYELWVRCMARVHLAEFETACGPAVAALLATSAAPISSSSLTAISSSSPTSTCTATPSSTSSTTTSSAGAPATTVPTSSTSSAVTASSAAIAQLASARALAHPSTTVTITEEADGKSNQETVTIPCLPSPYVVAFLHNLCAAINKAAGEMMPRQSLCDLAYEIGAGLNGVFARVLPAEPEPATIPRFGALQCIFDVRFLLEVLSAGRRPDIRRWQRVSDELTRRVRALMDAFDAALLEAHMVPLVLRCYQRSAALLGTLARIEKLHTEGAPLGGDPSPTNSLLLAQPCPRFPFIAVPAVPPPAPAPAPATKKSPAPSRENSLASLSLPAPRSIWAGLTGL